MTQQPTTQSPTHPHTSTQLIPSPSLFPGATTYDDAPLWLAWETAKNAWLDAKRRRSGGENTAKAYTIALQQFFDYVNQPPWAVSSIHAQTWAQELDAGDLAPATINLKLAACSSFYEFVQRRYIINRDGRDISLWPADRANPFDTVQRAKISPYGRAKYPSTDELKSILGSINVRSLTGKRDFALLYTISTTCRRSSEILNLRWGDITPRDDGDFTFVYRYKGGDIRRAVLHRLAYAAICAYLRADGRDPNEMQAGDYIFIPMHPERIARLPTIDLDDVDPNRPISNSYANRILKKYARRAGVDLDKCHLHGLRHAGARLRVEQQKTAGQAIDYMQVMVLLGHSSLAITQIYAQTVLEDPEDPGGDAAADALLPRARKRRRPQPKPRQEQLL